MGVENVGGGGGWGGGGAWEGGGYAQGRNAFSNMCPSLECTFISLPHVVSFMPAVAQEEGGDNAGQGVTEVTRGRR